MNETCERENRYIYIYIHIYIQGLVGKPEEGNNLEDLGGDGRTVLKNKSSSNRTEWRGLDLSASRYVQMAGCCEKHNES
jgi:hypothetical protein